MKIVPVKKATADSHIVFVFDEKKKDWPDFEAADDEVAICYDGDKTFILAGLGKKGDFSSHILRSQAARAMKKAAKLKRKKICIFGPDAPGEAKVNHAACLEGALLGAYSFDRHKSEKPESVKELQLTDFALSSTEVKNIQTVCDAVCFARDLVNDNAHSITPERLAREALDMADDSLKVKVLDEKMLKKEGLSLMAAVGQGSVYPPRLMVMEYSGAGPKAKKIALIGKGVTFDSGGLNLKSNEGMLTMRLDMAGAAAVLGIMKALAVLKPAVNVVGVVGAVQNAMDAKAYFPGDVYRSYAGKTVEIINTDAEGRLVLADAVAYCRKNYSPERIVDFATLTGACIIALGETVAGVISNNDNLYDEIFAAGEAVAERVWRLPLYPEHKKAMKSDIADLRNLAKFKRGYAGTITGGAFIAEFVEDTPWAHIDIAGTAFNESSARGEVPKFATGFGVRLALKWLGAY
ncbi:MAG: leucyl aminopeptidase [Desulfatibacillaceae bacterium]|nr:leucyl aminopeptidase [Desulfatibacillaceae bacterium]